MEPGIAKEKQDRIFEKFYQADKSHSQEGSGLGLAIVKRIVDLIDGKIEFESEENKGTVFTVYIKKV
jgi:signal transduction histidine kinase